MTTRLINQTCVFLETRLDLMQDVEFKVFAGPAKDRKAVLSHFASQAQAHFHVAQLMNIPSLLASTVQRLGLHQSQ